MPRIISGLVPLFVASTILFGCSNNKEPSIDYLPQIDKPDFTKLDGKEKKEAFFDYMYPIIVNKNIDILEERSLVENSDSANKNILEICAKYDIDCTTPDYKDKFTKNINIIPPSLALTQAAKESGWGTSRFSREGNNYFGQWCYKKGCGIVPKRRSDGAKHEVAKFKNAEESVEAYLFNLNTHSSYELLREIRNKDGLNGVKLAKGLIKYSEQREAYVESVIGMIKYNKLSMYDIKMLAHLKQDQED